MTHHLCQPLSNQCDELKFHYDNQMQCTDLLVLSFCFLILTGYRMSEGQKRQRGGLGTARYDLLWS